MLHACHGIVTHQAAPLICTQESKKVPLVRPLSMQGVAQHRMGMHASAALSPAMPATAHTRSGNSTFVPFELEE